MDESENLILSIAEASDQAILFSQFLNPFYDSELESESETDSVPESDLSFLSDDDDDEEEDDYHSPPPSPMANPPPESDPFLINTEDFFDSCPMEIGTTFQEAMEEPQEEAIEEVLFDADLVEWVDVDRISSGAVSELEIGDLDATGCPPEFADPDPFPNWVDHVEMENFSTSQEIDMDETQVTGPISIDDDPFSLDVPELFDCLPEHYTNQDQELEVEWDEMASTDTSIPDLEEILSNLEYEVFRSIHNIYEGQPEMEFFRPYAELDRILRGGTATSKAAVESLQNITVDESFRDLQCAVCKEVCLVGESVKRLPCSHDFHASCILPWLGIKNTCPLCRFELPVDEPDYESWSALQENQV